MSRWDERYEKASSDFERRPVRTGMKWFIGISALCGVLVLIVGLFGLVGGWINAGGDIISAENKKTQNRALYEGWEALQAAAINACAAENAPDTESTLIEDPAFAYAAQYRRIAVEYNRRWNDIFEAKIVGPRDIPQEAPSLKELQARLC